MTKVSVLVAVYNTADYLPQCLDSLLAQTVTDIEVLCVDDGSTDASPAILQQYAERDQRIKPTFLKENTGLAHARVSMSVSLTVMTGLQRMPLRRFMIPLRTELTRFCFVLSCILRTEESRNTR